MQEKVKIYIIIKFLIIIIFIALSTDEAPPPSSKKRKYNGSSSSGKTSSTVEAKYPITSPFKPVKSHGIREKRERDRRKGGLYIKLILAVRKCTRSN